MRKLVYVENDFKRFFKGLHIPDSVEIEPHLLAPKYEKLGVTKLVWREDTNTLIVHLQSPDLLIGERGKTIDALKEYMDCNIEIMEVKSLIEKYKPEPKTVRITEILNWAEQKTLELLTKTENVSSEDYDRNPDFEFIKLSGKNDLIGEILQDIRKRFNL